MYLSFYIISSFFLLFYFYYNKIYNYNLGLIFSFIMFLGISLLMNSNLNFFDWSNYKIYFLILLVLVFIPILTMSNGTSIDEQFLMSMVLLGSMLIVMSENLVVVYLSLELQTFSLFMLISSNSCSMKSSEGGLKYFMLGAMSSGIFLVSLLMIYYNTNCMTISSINSLNSFGYTTMWKYLLLLSMFFKLTLFPLHFWIPDIYEASKINVMALVGSLPKISILGFIMQVNIFSNLVMWCALGSVVVGTFGAMNQSKIKSLMAYSGMSHMGLGLLTLSTFVKNGLEPILLYITIYIIGFMSLVLLLEFNKIKSFYYIYDLSGLSKMSSIMALSWCLFLLSMGGLPPLSGFLIKWWVMWTMIINNYSLMGLLCVIFSAMGLIYYLSMTKMCYFQKSSSYVIWENMLMSKNILSFSSIYMGMGLYVTCFLILDPKFMMILADLSLMSLF